MASVSKANKKADVDAAASMFNVVTSVGALKLLLLLVIIVYIFPETGEASCWSCVARPDSKPGRKIPIVVWKKGFDYQNWVHKFFPLYVNDLLVFKYNNMKKNNITVYLIHDFESYTNCNVKKAKKLGGQGKGSSKGFKFLLRTARTYSFVSGDYYSCKHNKMKFVVAPYPIE